jgi:alpha-1,3-rhamnosyl/mannosyltransferase
MRVVVNRLVALGLKTGIGHYTEQLLRCLHAQPGADRIDSFPTGWVRRAGELYAHLRPPLGNRHRPAHARPLLADLRGRVRQSLRQAGMQLVARQFARLCARHGYDVYHEPNFIPLPCDRPTVTTLHDLSVLLHPEWHPADRVAYYEKHFPRVLNQCVHFLTVSDFVRQEVIQKLHVPPHRVTRVYNGVRPEFRPLPEEVVAQTLRRLGLPPRYLLSVSTIEPRKNVLLLLQAYCALPADVRERWPLVLVGGWGWNAAAVAEYLNDIARHRGVRHLGYLADADLPAVYNGARALLYPSHYEGFGLPPLEMMACGGAVLTSTAGALVETTGGRAYLIAPDDLDGWRAALARVTADDDWWRSLRRDVAAVARPYTWGRCAAATLRVYRSLADGARAQPWRRAG